MRRFALILVALATSVQASEWSDLAGDQIRDALEDRKLTYESGAWQDFRASGRTLYNAGRDSWGSWTVRADQYCSQWPPSTLWACFDIQGHDTGVKFIDENGEVTEGRYPD